MQDLNISRHHYCYELLLAITLILLVQEKVLADDPGHFENTTPECGGYGVGDSQCTAVLETPHLIHITWSYCANSYIDFPVFSARTDIVTPFDQVDEVTLAIYPSPGSAIPGGYTECNWPYDHSPYVPDLEFCNNEGTACTLGHREIIESNGTWLVHYTAPTSWQKRLGRFFHNSHQGCQYACPPSPPYDWYVRLVSINGVPVAVARCINDDPELVSPDRWEKIGSPEWLSGTITSAVRLDYHDGIAQVVELQPGTYSLSITVTERTTPSLPSLSSVILSIDGESKIFKLEQHSLAFDFMTTSPGPYRIQIQNASEPTVTLDYACVSTSTVEICTFDDHDFDTGNWVGEGNVRWVESRVVIGCDSFVEQQVYLPKGLHEIELHAGADFSVYSIGSHFNTGGDLTILYSSSNVEREVQLYIDKTGVYTFEMDVPFSGYYTFRLWNRDNCYSKWWGLGGSKEGDIWLDYICLPWEVTDVGPRVGDCIFVRDSSMSGWGWNGSNVEWTGQTGIIAAGGYITQSINISTTNPVTSMIAYIVARSSHSSRLFASLGPASHTFTISDSEFAVLTATLPSSLPAPYSLNVEGGSVEVDFTCLYDKAPDGAWYPGADGDSTCIEPLPPDLSGGFWDDVAAILKLIWEWIKYIACLIELWLSRIWFKLGRWLGSIVVDLGDWIDDLTVSIMNWPITVLLFDLLMFAAWLPARFLDLLIKILSPVIWAWDFIRTLVPALLENISNPNSVQSLELGELEDGFNFIKNVLDNTPLSLFISIVNAILWFVFIVWSIKQFSQSNT